MMIPATPFSCRVKRGIQEGAVMGGGCDQDNHKEEEEEKWSQKKEQLTVIIVMFNQTPAIKLINTLFPVWVHMRWAPLRHCSAL